MSERRGVGRMTDQMREAMEQYSREELMDLLTHIVRVYVVEGGGAGVSVESAPQGLSELRGLSFSQLVLHLQMNLPHEELRRLHVSGSRVWMSSSDGRELDLTEEAPLEAPPDPEVIEPSAPVDESPRARVPAQEAFGSRGARRGGAPGVSAVDGPVVAAPQGREEGSAPLGAPRPRRAPRQDAGSVAQRAGQVARPDVGLRGEQPSSTPRLPPSSTREQRDWLEDMGGGRRQAASSGPSPAEASSESVEDEVGEVSDRFSMLELD